MEQEEVKHEGGGVEERTLRSVSKAHLGDEEGR